MPRISDVGHSLPRPPGGHEEAPRSGGRRRCIRRSPGTENHARRRAWIMSANAPLFPLLVSPFRRAHRGESRGCFLSNFWSRLLPVELLEHGGRNAFHRRTGGCRVPHRSRRRFGNRCSLPPRPEGEPCDVLDTWLPDLALVLHRLLGFWY